VSSPSNAPCGGHGSGGDPAPARRGLRILFAEDRQEDVELSVVELRKAGLDVEVDVVATLPDFEARVRGREYDVVLSDYNLGGWSGLDALEALRARGHDTPFLLVTGSLGDEAAVDCVKRGVEDYVTKDRLARLPMAVRQAIAQHALRRREAETVGALQESEERFRALIENSMDLVAVLDAGGRFAYASPSVGRLFGYAPTELLGENAFDYVAPADVERVRAAFRKAVAGGAAEIREEYGFRHKDGSWRTLESVVSNLLDNPAVAGIVINSRDVTERRTLESQFRQAQRLEAVGRLAGGVAHDFNNVLTAIAGYSDLLLEDLDARDPKRQDVEEIRAAAQRAATLTRQLLAFSRKQVLQSRVLDLNAVVQALEKMLQRLIGEDVELVFSPGADLRPVRADPGQIEQVILNLAVNARDAMPRGGKLTIETANVELDATYVRDHHGAVPGRYVLLAVSDTGVGMEPETRSHIFEPFFTTKEPGKGTGLGLATVYGIVKQSGGYVWVYSEPGRGATFKIYLPWVDEQVPTQHQVAAVSLVGGSETVLLAEDDPSVRDVVGEVLTQKGYRVLRAPDGQTALDLARGHLGEIQLLVTDMVMPGMAGRELAEAVAARRPGIRVLYMSGYTDDAVVRHGVLEQGMPYIQKPFSAAGLAAKVREILDRAPAPEPGRS
jgi:PAS domain S-box-containing protein